MPSVTSQSVGSIIAFNRCVNPGFNHESPAYVDRLLLKLNIGAIIFSFVLFLLPSQVLYVPRHWWHYVESVDPVTVSVNSWIELVSLRQFKAASVVRGQTCWSKAQTDM